MAFTKVPQVALSDYTIPPKGKNWWKDVPCRLVIYNERFAYDLNPEEVKEKFLKYIRPVTKDIKASSGTSKVTNDETIFRIELTVDSFTPEELQVKVVDEFVAVSGHHEEKAEKNGFVSRTFTRQYQMPRECSSADVKTIFKNGILIIEAPKQEVKMATKHDVREDCIS